MTSANRSRSLYRRKHRPAITVTRTKEADLLSAKAHKRALVATSEQEYRRMLRNYPDRRVVLDAPQVQSELFNTRQFIDA